MFSMLSNNYLLSPRSAEDALGVTLASWSDADGADAPSVTSRSLRRTTDYGPAPIECSWAKASEAVKQAASIARYSGFMTAPLFLSRNDREEEDGR